jgi:hypothetical protein
MEWHPMHYVHHLWADSEVTTHVAYAWQSSRCDRALILLQEAQGGAWSIDRSLHKSMSHESGHSLRRFFLLALLPIQLGRFLDRANDTKEGQELPMWLSQWQIQQNKYWQLLRVHWPTFETTSTWDGREHLGQGDNVLPVSSFCAAWNQRRKRSWLYHVQVKEVKNFMESISDSVTDLGLNHAGHQFFIFIEVHVINNKDQFDVYLSVCTHRGRSYTHCNW